MKITFEIFLMKDKQITPIRLCTNRERVDLGNVFDNEEDVIEAIKEANFIYYKPKGHSRPDYFPIEGNKLTVLKMYNL